MSVVNIPTTASGYYENIVSQARQAQRAVNKMQMSPKLNASGIIQPLGRIVGSASEFQKSMDASAARVFAFGAAVGVINGISDAFKGLIASAAEVEKSLKDIQVVMETTDSAMQKFGKGLFDVARNTATGFQAVAESATELARQGLSAEETLARVNSALILSRLSGLDTVKSTETLTAAINSFNKEGITHTEIVNRMANVDAAFAVSSADLAEAVSRAGAVAQSSGVSFNELASVITAVQQRTARGGSVIGNGFKSIFTRIKRSRVREALEEIGVATQDNNGNFRSAMAILQDYASVYKTLSDTQKAYTSEQIAGVYQIQNLQALIQDLNSGYSVYNKALSVANNTTNEATMRNEELNKTLSAIFQQTNLSAKELASSIGQIGLSGNFKEILTFLNTLAKNLNDLLSEDKGSQLAKSLVSGIGNFLTGPGLVIIGAAFIKIFGLVIKFAKEAFGDVLGLNKETKRQQTLQAAITQILTTNSGVYQKILAAGANTAKQEQIILNIIRQETAERLKQEALIKRIAAGSRLAGIGASEAGFVPMGSRVARGKGKRTLGMAEGFLPSFMKETLDINKGVGGARKGDRPVRQKIKTTPGKTSDVIAHTGEWIVRNYNNSGADAIFNRDMAKTMGLPKGAKKINAAGGLIPNFGKRMTVTSSASGMSKGGIISKDADSFDQFTGTFNVERLAKKSKEYGSRAHRWITGGSNASGVIDPNQIKSKQSNAWIYKQADPRTGKESYVLKGGEEAIKRKMEKLFWPGVTNGGQGQNAFTTMKNITKESWAPGQKVPKSIVERFRNLTKSLKGLQAERLSHGKLKARNENPKYIEKNSDFDILAKGGMYEVKSSENQSMIGVLAKGVRSFLKRRRLNKEPILRGNGRTDNVNINNTFGQDALNLITASDTKILDKGVIKTEKFKRKVFEEEYSPNIFANSGSKIPTYASGFIPNFMDRRSRAQKIKDVLADPANRGIKFKSPMMDTKTFSTVKKGMGGEFQKMWIESYLKHGRAGDYQMLMKMGYNPDELLNLKKHFERGGKVNIKTLSKGLVPNFSPRWKRFSGKYNSDKYLKNLKQKKQRNREMNEAGYVKAAEGAQKFQRFNDKFGLEKIDDFFQIFPFFSRGYMPKQGLGVKRSFVWQPDGRKDWYTQFAGKSSEMQSFIKWAEANKKLPPNQLTKLKNVITQDAKKYEKSYWEDYEKIRTGNSNQASRRNFYGTNATSPRAMPGDEKMRLNITDPKNKLFIKQDKMNELIADWKRSQGSMGFATGFIPNFGKILATSRGPITAQQITRLKSGQQINNKQTGEKLYLNQFTPADQAAIKKYEADNSKRVMAQRQRDSKAAKNQLKTIDASRQATMLVATKNLKQKVDTSITSNNEKIRLKYRVEGIKNKNLADQETALRNKAEKFMLEQAHLTALKLAGTGQFAANTPMPKKVANAGSIGSAAGSIFETAVQSLGKNKLFTKNNATFDIQGFPDNNLKKLFGYYTPFADAKIGLTPGTKSDFNQKLLAVPAIKQKITDKQRREQGKVGLSSRKNLKTGASGYIPNFNKFLSTKGVSGAVGGLGLSALLLGASMDDIGEAPAVAALASSLMFGAGSYLGTKLGGKLDDTYKNKIKLYDQKIGNTTYQFKKADLDEYKKLSTDIGERFKATTAALMDGLSGNVEMDNAAINKLDKQLKELKKESKQLRSEYIQKSKGISGMALNKTMRRGAYGGRRGRRFSSGYLPNFNKKAWMSSKEFAKFSGSVGRFNQSVSQGQRGAIQSSPLRAPGRDNLFAFSRRKQKESLSNIKQYINSDFFRSLDPKIQKSVVQFYNKRASQIKQNQFAPQYLKDDVGSVARTYNFSSGYTPNYNNPLMQALSREKAALRERGIASSAIRVESSPALRGPMNPGGLAVTNKVDEPLGVSQGIRRSKSMGIDPKTHGMTPNFALPLALPLLKSGFSALMTTLPLVANLGKKAGGAAKNMFKGSGEMSNLAMGGMFALPMAAEGIRGGRSDEEVSGARGMAMDAANYAGYGAMLGGKGMAVGAALGAISGLGRMSERDSSVKTFEKLAEQKKKLDEVMKDAGSIQKYANGVVGLNEALKSGDFDAITEAQEQMFDAMSSVEDIDLINKMNELKNSSMSAEEKLSVLNKEMENLGNKAGILKSLIEVTENLQEGESKGSAENLNWFEKFTGKFAANASGIVSFMGDFVTGEWDGMGTRAAEAQMNSVNSNTDLDAYASKDGRAAAKSIAETLVKALEQEVKSRIDNLVPDELSSGRMGENLDQDIESLRNVVNLMQEREGEDDPEARRAINKKINDVGFVFDAIGDRISDILDMDLSNLEKIGLLNKEIDELGKTANEAAQFVGKSEKEIQDLTRRDTGALGAQQAATALMRSNEINLQADMIKSGDRDQLLNSKLIQQLRKEDEEKAEKLMSDLGTSKILRSQVAGGMIKAQDRASVLGSASVGNSAAIGSGSNVDDVAKKLKSSYQNMIALQNNAKNSLDAFNARVRVATSSLDSWIERLASGLEFRTMTGDIDSEEARKKMNQMQLLAFDEKNDLAQRQSAQNILFSGMDYSALFNPSKSDLAEVGAKETKPRNAQQMMKQSVADDEQKNMQKIIAGYQSLGPDPSVDAMLGFANSISHLGAEGNNIANKMNTEIAAMRAEAKIQREKMIHQMKLQEGQEAFSRMVAVGGNAMTPGGRQTLGLAIGQFDDGPSKMSPSIVPRTDEGIVEELNKWIATSNIAATLGIPEGSLTDMSTQEAVFSKGLLNLELAIRDAMKQGNMELVRAFKEAREKLIQDNKTVTETNEFIETTTGTPMTLEPMMQVSYQLAQIQSQGLNLKNETISSLGTSVGIGVVQALSGEGNGLPAAPGVGNEELVSSVNNLTTSIEPLMVNLQSLNESTISLVEPLNNLQNLPQQLRSQLEGLVLGVAVNGELNLNFNTSAVQATLKPAMLDALRELLMKPIIIDYLARVIKQKIDPSGVLNN